jgi:hypothetical protein
MSRLIDWTKRQEIINSLVETFPDIRSSGMVTFNQVIQVLETCPIWIRENTVERGIYNISEYINNEKVENVIPIKSVKNTVMGENKNQFIPVIDNNYVPFGNYKDIEKIISSKMFYPVYLTGPTGNGKSTSIEQICAKHKVSLIRVNINMMSDEDQLIGSKTLEDGNIKVVEGPILQAMRLGCTILIDECDAANSNTIMCLQSILEGKPYYFKLKNEIITPTHGFNIIATANSKGKGSEDGRYIGTNILNEAFLERFAVTFEQDYPPSSVELKIVSNIIKQYNCMDEEFANTLIKWSNAIRMTFKAGGLDENITTRRIIHIVRAFSIFNNKRKAVELCCNRFDINTKTAFLSLYDKISGDPECDVAELNTEQV